MLARVGHERQPSMSVGRPVQVSTNIARMDTSHNKHWPGRIHTKRGCRVCSAVDVKRTAIFRCVKCDVVLCVARNCFQDYYTKTILQDIYSSVLRTNSWSLDHRVSKRTWIFTNLFSETILLHYTIWTVQRLKTHWALSGPFPTKCFCFTNLSRVFLQIFRFLKHRLKNLNTPQNNWASCDIKMGYNSTFKGPVIATSMQCREVPVSLNVPHNTSVLFQVWTLG